MIRYKAATEATRRKQDKEREAAGLPPVQRTGGRGMPPGRGNARGLPTGRGAPRTNVGAGRSHTNRNGGQGPAPPAAPARGGGGGGFRGRGGGPGGRPSHVLDQNVWNQLIDHLRKKQLLPVVNFVFSKKRCEEYAATLQKLDMTTAKEKSEVHVTWEKALGRLKGELSNSAARSGESQGDMKGSQRGWNMRRPNVEKA